MKLNPETSNELNKHLFNLAAQSFKIANCPSPQVESIHTTHLINALEKLNHLIAEIDSTLSSHDFTPNEKMRTQIHKVITNTIKSYPNYNDEDLTNPEIQAEHKAYHELKSIFEQMLKLIPRPSHETYFSTGIKVPYDVIHSVNASLDAIQDIQPPNTLQKDNSLNIGLASLITLSRRNSGFSQTPPRSPLSDDTDNSQTFGPDDQAHRPFTSR